MSELSAALVAALKDLTTVEAGRTADAGSYTYDYADLADIVRLTRPVLASHDVIALTPLGAHGDKLAVSVHLIHSSGESLVLGPFPFPPGRDAQATGSMVTYMRRYALLAALGMATGDDDDGHAATQAARQPEPAPPAELTEARALAHSLGDAAKTVVPSIIEETTGRKAKLADLSVAELRDLLPELRRCAADSEAVAGGA